MHIKKRFVAVMAEQVQNLKACKNYWTKIPLLEVRDVLDGGDMSIPNIKWKVTTLEVWASRSDEGAVRLGVSSAPESGDQMRGKQPRTVSLKP